jgi:hypothetical protein
MAECMPRAHAEGAFADDGITRDGTMPQASATAPHALPTMNCRRPGISPLSMDMGRNCHRCPAHSSQISVTMPHGCQTVLSGTPRAV